MLSTALVKYYCKNYLELFLQWIYHIRPRWIVPFEPACEQLWLSAILGLYSAFKISRAYLLPLPTAANVVIRVLRNTSTSYTEKPCNHILNQIISKKHLSSTYLIIMAGDEGIYTWFYCTLLQIIMEESRSFFDRQAKFIVQFRLQDVAQFRVQGVALFSPVIADVATHRGHNVLFYKS